MTRNSAIRNATKLQGNREQTDFPDDIHTLSNMYYVTYYELHFILCYVSGYVVMCLPTGPGFPLPSSPEYPRAPTSPVSPGAPKMTSPRAPVGPSSPLSPLAPA